VAVRRSPVIERRVISPGEQELRDLIGDDESGDIGPRACAIVELVPRYLGGLSFQIEHHLFPEGLHIHHPRISRIVEASCLEYGVHYLVQEGVISAATSPCRWLGPKGGAR